MTEPAVTADRKSAVYTPDLRQRPDEEAARWRLNLERELGWPEAA